MINFSSIISQFMALCKNYISELRNYERHDLFPNRLMKRKKLTRFARTFSEMLIKYELSEDNYQLINLTDR